jgi:hypothetical protein
MLPTIPHDKALHLVYGAVVYTAAAVVMSLAGFPHFAHQVAAFAVIVAAFGKEGADYYANWKARKQGSIPTHGVELADLICTLLGGSLCGLAAVVAG